MESRVSYERLFNIGNFEHEKFIITKDLDGAEIPDLMKELVVLVADLEEEIGKFRAAYRERHDLLQHLGWACTSEESRAEIRKRLEHLDLIMAAFRFEHKPLFRECKCFYCQNPDWDEYEDR